MFSCKEQPKTCEDFHLGVFEMNKPEDNYAAKIERIDQVQIETNLNTGDVTKAFVTWKGACEYELTYTESTSPEAVNLIGKVLQVRITGIQGSSYTYEAVLRGTKIFTQGRIQLAEWALVLIFSSWSDLA